jgi:pilus assembly protein FimV
MVRKLAVLVLGCAGLTPSVVSALGLGDINVKSFLNQPLNAEVELLNVRDLTAQEILPGLATKDDFARAGVDRNYFLTGLRYEVVVRDNGTAFVKVTSHKPVREPFLNFLVEVHWPAGRLLREYTLLLDPPTFSDDIASSVKPALSANTQQSTQPAVTTTAVPQRTPPQATTRTNTSTSSNYGQTPYQAPGTATESRDTPDSYRTTSSDSLWKVAAKLRPVNDVTVQQTMVAIQRENPNAFIDNNINLLRAGQVIRTPSANSVRQITRQQAIEEVARQNKAWQNRGLAKTQSDDVEAAQISSTTTTDAPATPSGESGTLRLVTADGAGQGGVAQTANNGATASTTSAASGEIKNKLLVTEEKLEAEKLEKQSLEVKVTDLQEQVQTGEKLISLKDEQISALQARLKELEEKNQLLAQQAQEAAAQATTSESGDTETEGGAGQETEAGLGGELQAGLDSTLTAAQETVDGAVEDVSSTAEGAVGGVVDSAVEGAEGAVETAVEGLEGAVATAEEAVGEVDYNFVDESEASDGAVTDSTSESSDGLMTGMETEAPENATSTVAVNPEPEPAPAEKVVSQAPTPVKSGGFLSTPILAGIGVTVLLLLGGLFAMLRNRKPATGEDELVADLDDNFAMGDLAAEGAAVNGGLMDGGASDLEDVASEIEDAISEDDLAAGEKDVIGEVDIYMAYGRFDQAVDFLKEAIDKDPVRADYRLKLLEVYAESGDTEGFLAAEQELTALGDDQADAQAHDLHEKLRENAARLGKSIEGLDPSGNDDTQLQFNTNDTQLQEDLEGDSGAAVMEPVTDKGLPEAPVEFDNAIDFNLDDDDTVLHKADAELTDAELPDLDSLEQGSEFDIEEPIEFDLDADTELMEADVSGISDVEPEAGFDADLDTEEELGPLSEAVEPPDNLVKLDEMDSTIDSNAAASIASEFDDDLDFDLDADLDSPDTAPASATPSLEDDDNNTVLLSTPPSMSPAVAEVTDSLETSLDELDAELADADLSGAVETAAEADFDLQDLDDASLDDAGLDDAGLDDAGLEDLSADMDLPELDVPDFDTALDTDGLDSEAANDTADVAEFDQAESLGSADSVVDITGEAAMADDLLDENVDEEDLGFLADSDEIATKLDLARAYIDMGDRDGAKDILDEVLLEGNDEQQGEAKTLLQRVENG